MKDTHTIAEIAAQLRADGMTRHEALRIADSVKGPRLAELAREVGAGTRRGKVELIRQSIVQAAVSDRLGQEAILNSRWDRPIPADAVNLRPVPAFARRLPTADDLRTLAAAIQSGDVTDPAVLADLAAAATELLAAARIGAPAADTADTADALHVILDNRRGSGWSGIADVRDALPHLSRAEQDALMVELLRDGRVDIIPSANLKALSGRERDAALLLGGQQTHAIRVR